MSPPLVAAAVRSNRAEAELSRNKAPSGLQVSSSGGGVQNGLGMASVLLAWGTPDLAGWWAWPRTPSCPGVLTVHRDPRRTWAARLAAGYEMFIYGYMLPGYCA